MKPVLIDLKEAKKKIDQGKKLLLAGDENLLQQLPSGNWIAGTIPYFMSESGGVFSKDKLYVTEMPDYIGEARIKIYDEKNMAEVYRDGLDNGFSLMIVPAFCTTHLSFSLNAPNYEEFATKLLLGWVAGVELKSIGARKPKVIAGNDRKLMENGAVVMHVSLPKNKYADVKIINIFKQGRGDTITFPEDGFSVADAIVNGERQNFAEYLIRNKFDTKFPLTANYSGSNINVSFQKIDEENKKVDFYAPVFKGMTYKLAAPVEDYVACFTRQVPEVSPDNIFFSCNCILNYLYSELEGKKTEGFTGPVTFGEIAFQLLNQTLVYVTINDL